MIPISMSPVNQPYPFDALPPSIQQAFFEVQRALQAPDALIAMSFLSVVSVACQRLINVKIPSGQIKPVSLNLLAVADSGERKTSVDNMVAAPIYAHDDDSARLNEAALRAFNASLAAWNAVATGLQRRVVAAVRTGQATDSYQRELMEHEQKRPEAPILRRILHQNATHSALMQALEGERRSIAVMSDEGDIVLRSGALTHLGTFNKLWDGASTVSIDRVTTNSSIARNPRVTVSVMVQRTILQKYLNGRGAQSRGAGLLARFLVADPPSTKGRRFNRFGDEPLTYLPKFQQRVRDLLVRGREMDAESQQTIAVEFSKAAAQRWLEIADQAEYSMQPGHNFSSVSDFAAKAPENVGRLAALFHYFSGLSGGISMEALESAITVVNWHGTEYKRMFDRESDVPEEISDAQKLERYLRARYWMNQLNVASKNAVLQTGPVRPSGKLDAALMVLCANNKVRVDKADPISKTLWIFLNPDYFAAQPSHLRNI